MAGENIVRILVTADNATQAAFDEAGAGADEMAAKVTAAMEEYQAAFAESEAAADSLAAASAKLDEVMADESASTEERAAAQNTYTSALDRNTEAALASMDAQARLGEADLAAADSAKVAGDAAEDQGAKTGASAGLMAGAGGKMKMAMLGVAVGMGIAVKAAGDFQQQTTRLVTSAGESAKNLGMVQRGMLALSASTDTSTQQLASGMYLVESAGFHGANGLIVLKAAAQGAQAEGADLSTVSDALTSALNAYGLGASHATQMTNMMLTAVGQGKMTMQNFAGSLAAVLPVAAAAHISFAQVAGAIATMTAQGMSANEATQLLRHTITSLQAPNSVQVAEMQQLGVNSNELAKNIGKNGLTGTIQQLEQAILTNMGPAGMVLLKSFNQSKLAAQSAQTEIEAMPPSLQKLAEAYANGTISVAAWQKIMFQGSLPASQKNLLQQFASTENAAKGFSSELKSGQGNAQTFTAALSKVMGGAEGLQVALQVGGAHMTTFKANVNDVAAAGRHAGGNIQNWGTIQKNFNFQLGSAEKAIKAAGIALGMVLLPAVTGILHPLAGLLTAIAGNKVAAIALATVVGGVLAGALGSKLAGAFKGVESGVKSASSAVEWLIGRLTASTAATEAQTVATEEQAAATEEGTVAQEGMDAAMDANPIGLIIAALVALAAVIYEAVKHWRLFRDAAVDAWHGIRDAALAAWHFLDDDVIHPIMSAVGDVVSFIRDHWKLLAAIFLGPIGLIADALATHWHAIEDGFRDAWNAISAIVSKGVGIIKDIIDPYIEWSEDIFKAAWDVIETVFKAAWTIIRDYVAVQVDAVKAVLNWFTGLAGLFRGWWDAAANAVRAEIDKLLGFVESIPGRINSALGGLPGMLFSAGAHVIESLIDGIMSKVGSLGSAMGTVAHKVAGFFGLSPAREGPLSGGGAPQIRGQHIAADIASGMLSGVPRVGAAAGRLASAAGISGAGTIAGGAGGGLGGAGGQLVLRIEGGGGELDQFMVNWIRQHARILGGGGPDSVQRAFGRVA